MKGSLTSIICALISLIPVLATGQTNQEPIQKSQPKPQPETPHRAAILSNMEPLLRLSNTGLDLDEGVSLELNSSDLLHPAGTIFLDCPDPLIPGSGAIRLLPDNAGSYLRINNMDVMDLDRIGLDIGPSVLQPYRPRLVFSKPLVPGNQSAVIIEPGEETPRLSISNIGVSGQDGIKFLIDDPLAPNNFFNRFFDLQLRSESLSYLGEYPELSRTWIYDPTKPSMTHRLLTADPQYADSFFDIAVNFEDIFCSIKVDDLEYSKTFEPPLFRLRDRVSSSALGVDSFFDIFYDIGTSSETHVFGDLTSELSVAQIYDKATPKLLERIASTNPGLEDSFFDITYDLDYAGGGGGGAGKVQYQDYHFSSIFQPDDSRFRQVVASDNPLLLDKFFTMDYNLDMDSWSMTHKDLIFENVLISDSNDKIIQRHLRSTSPGTPEWNYNWDFLDRKIEYGLDDFLVIEVFDPDAPKLFQRIESQDPILLGRYLEVETDLSTPLVISRDMEAGFITEDPIAFHLDFDGAARTVRNSMNDGNNFNWDFACDLDDGLYTRSYNTLRLAETFHPDVPSFVRRLESNDPVLVGRFFEVQTEMAALNLVSQSMTAGFPTEDPIALRFDFNGEARSFVQTLDSGNNENWAFALDLDGGVSTRSFGDLLLVETFEPESPIFKSKLESTDPLQVGRYLEMATALDQPDIVSFGFEALATGGNAPLQFTWEFNGDTRKVTETTTDVENGVSLLLDRRLDLSGPSLAIGGGLRVNGGSVSSDTGPLLLVDDVQVIGALTVVGPKNFIIDHPLDPDNKYLFHSCIESPDMMNIYNGNATTNKEGYAVVQLPDYFEALNIDYRYQLTCIGQFAQAIVADKIRDNQFTIRTDIPNVEVSWQVTGIRNDPAAIGSNYQVEKEKEPEMKNTRLYPVIQ